MTTAGRTPISLPSRFPGEAGQAANIERLADFGRSAAEAAQEGRGGYCRQADQLRGRDRRRVRLIDATQMRVGNEEYAKANKSFGATTLRNRHAKVGRRASSRSAIPASTASSAPSPSPTAASPASPGRPRTCRASICSSSTATMAMSGRSARATSTPISARRWARSSPPRISAPGAPASSPSGDGGGAPRARQASLKCDDRAGRRGARQHGRDQPQILRPPGPDRGGQDAGAIEHCTAAAARPNI